MVFLIQGPADAYVCANCYLTLERQYKVRQSESETSIKRKLTTPDKSTPRNKKKPKSSVKTPNSGRFSPRCKSTPIRTPKKSPKKLGFSPRYGPTTSRHKRGSLQGIMASISHSRYLTAFKHICERSAAAAAAFNEFVAIVIRKQMQTFTKQNDLFPILKNLDSLNDFSWSKLMPVMETHLPTLSAALQGAMPKEENISDFRFR